MLFAEFRHVGPPAGATLVFVWQPKVVSATALGEPGSRIPQYTLPDGEMKKYPGSWLAKPLSGCESPAAGRAGMSPGAPSPEPPSPEPPSPEPPSPERPSPVWVTVVVSPAPADPPEPVSTVVGSAVTVVVVGVGLGCDSVEQAEAPSSATAAVMRSRARERGMSVMSGLSPKGRGRAYTCTSSTPADRVTGGHTASAD